MPTIKQIAKLAGVSTATVSRVVNSKPGVAAETQKKVQKIIKRYQYKPSAAARSLVTKRSHSIGLLLSDITNPAYAELANAIEQEARKSNYVVIFFSTGNDLKLQKRGIDFLREKQVDAIIFASVFLHNPEVEKLAGEGFPLVLVNRRLEHDIASYVVMDDVLGGYKATEHLIKLGHRRIGMISGPISYSTGSERMEGYRKALREYHIPIDRKLIKMGDFRKNSGYIAGEQFIRMAHRPTAIFAANDYMAIGAFEVISDKGLRVPEDIAIVGNDDVEWASFGGIRPTTIRGDKLEMGKKTMQLVLKKLQTGKTNDLYHIVLDPKLIIRDSCGYQRKKQEGGEKIGRSASSGIEDASEKKRISI